jgi:hypothetical protein
VEANDFVSTEVAYVFGDGLDWELPWVDSVFNFNFSLWNKAVATDGVECVGMMQVELRVNPGWVVYGYCLRCRNAFTVGLYCDSLGPKIYNLQLRFVTHSHRARWT